MTTRFWEVNGIGGPATLRWARDPSFAAQVDGDGLTMMDAIVDGGLPKGHPLDYTLSIAENPRRRGMLFAGTGHAFFYSLDDGKSWTRFKDKLPAAPVTWIEVPKNAAEVAVATYGRGLWVLRDIWQLEQPDVAAAAAPQPAELAIYKPLPGTRTAGGGT